MRDLNLIFIVDRNWNIGLKGDMLYKTKVDLEHFKDITYGNVLVMGRSTLESLPNGDGLEGRINIVLSRDKNYKANNIVLVNNINELENELEKYNDKRAFLIGGGNLVNQLFAYCNYAYITKIDHSFEIHDTSLPNLDKMDDWQVVKEKEAIFDGKYSLQFLEYKKIEK